MSIKAATRADRKGNKVIAQTLKDGSLATGAKENSVKWLERMLKLAGFNPGKYDKVFDKRTAAVLRQFQAARGLPATGELDLKTFEHLKQVQTRARKSRGQPVLGRGQKDEMILNAEKRLRALGYTVGKADGVFDAQTAQALKQYKVDQGKEFKSQGGLLGESARKSLAREVRELQHAPERRRITGKKAKKSYRSLDALTRKEVAKTHQVPVLDAKGLPRLDEAGKALTRKVTGLGVGDKGRAVANIENYLEKAGYDVGRRDGRFDSRTEAVLKAFQRRAGLKDTGRVGPGTWAKLRQSVILAKDGFSPAQGLHERSAAVKRSEKLLQKLGYLKKGEVDGLFDRDTLRASRRFEKKYGYGEDGRIGEGQFEKMERVYKARQNPLGRGMAVTGYRNGASFRTRVYNVGGGEYMQKNAGINYLKMIKAARKAGISLSNTSGFRTYSEQAALYAQYGPGRAARPGYSNHQQGLSMDIGGVNGYGTAAYNWLQRNAGRFGFRNDVPGEFWHWTYYGRGGA